MCIGERIKDIRKKRGYTQKSFAAALHVSSGCLSKYETGRCSIPTDVLIRSADLLEVSLDYLTGRNRLVFDYSCLNAYFTGKVRTSSVLSDALSLPEGERAIMYEILIALKYKQTMKNEKR